MEELTGRNTTADSVAASQPFFCDSLPMMGVVKKKLAGMICWTHYNAVCSSLKAALTRNSSVGKKHENDTSLPCIRIAVVPKVRIPGFARNWTGTKMWSTKFSPTPGKSTSVLMSKSLSSFWLPIPYGKSQKGESNYGFGMALTRKLEKLRCLNDSCGKDHLFRRSG